MKKLFLSLIIILFILGAAVWAQYGNQKTEKVFPYRKPIHSVRNLENIRDGDHLLILRNPGSDLHISMEGSKDWKNIPLRVQFLTESKEIGSEVFSWPYWSKSIRLDARQLDPSSFVKVVFHYADPAPVHFQKFEVRTNRQYPQVLIIGMDGATLRVLEPLVKAGQCPNFKKLMQEGAYGTLLSEEPAYSPVIWTTLATGRSPDEHGITFFLARNEPETSDSIRVKRFWNIFSQYSKLNSMILGWYLTWPVEKLQGGMVSDRSYYHFKRYKDMSYPPEYFDTEFQKLYVTTSWAVDKHLRRFTDYPYTWEWRKKYAFGSVERHDSSIVDQRLAHVYRRDAAFADFGLRMLKNLQPDVLAVYLRGADFTSHGFWKFRHPDQVPFFSVSDQQKAWFSQVIDRYYIYLDEILGKYLEAAGPDSTVFILSDHGFRAISQEEATNPELSGEHDLNGIIFCKGPAFKKGYRIPNATLYDFLPTLLYLYGLPQANDMRGRVLTDAMNPDFGARHPVRRIATYGSRVGMKEQSSEQMDEEIKEELRSLGYIQ